MNMPKLLVKRPDGKEEIFRINRIRITIGRSIRNDICIPDPFISRFHAEIRRDGDLFLLRDLGSANGTIHNNKPISNYVRLSPNDEIRLGETKIIFQDDSTALQNPTLITEGTIDSSNTVFLDVKQRQNEAERKDFLALISKVGTALLDSTSLEETLNLITSLVFELIPAERCAILFRNTNSSDGLKIAIARLRQETSSPIQLRISKRIVDEVLLNKRAVLTSNAQNDPLLSSQTFSLAGIKSVLAVPLGIEDDTFGMIYVDSPIAEAVFEEEHLNILTTLASVASIRIEKSRLLEEKLQRERLEHELKLAAEIQQRLQPSRLPCIENYEFEGISLSCYEVGGDYYDFIERDNKRLIVALGDVSGKGTSAALMMASLHAAIHSQISLNLELTKTISAVNKYLVDSTPQNCFVTLFIAELDCETGTIEFISAGHESALIVRSTKQVDKLSSNSLPLGLFEHITFEIEINHLDPGDVLVVFSDGVSEALSPTGEEFGIERLAEVIKDNLQLPGAGLRDKIDSALSKFTNNSPSKDDITLLIVKRKA